MALLAYAKKLSGKIRIKDIAIIGVLVSLSALGRIAASALPSIQPSSFIIISSGMILGGGIGYFVGILTALLSNIYLGFGPWLPWQTLLWGLMGMTSRHLRGKSKIAAAIFGFLWGVFFGQAMNLYWYFDGYMPFSWKAYALSCAASLQFDLYHGLTNAALLLIFYNKKLFSRLEKEWKK